LEDYLKAIDFLTIGNENRLQKQVEDAIEQSKITNDNIKSQLYEKGQAIANLSERDSLNTDAIASLSDQVMKLMREIEMLKKDKNNITTT
jgi:hypothetical protein